MLDTLHRIIQEVNAARGLDQALGIIVQRVAEAMGVDVCSVYLLGTDNSEYTLMATVGLNPAAVGRVRLRAEEGLVGLVGERAEPINLENADEHPRFRYFPETGEERFCSFLGVPIIHFRRLLGVLVVQQQVSRRFDEDEVAFLVTMAAQLSGAIAHGEVSGLIEGLHGRAAQRSRHWSMTGAPGAPGIGMGTAVVVYELADLSGVPDRKSADPQQDEAAFLAAVETVREEVKELSRRMINTLPTDEHSLFDVYLRMLDGASLVERTVRRIREGNWAAGALRETIGEHVRVFEEMDDPYLRERSSDVRDIGRRILTHLQLDRGAVPEIPDRAVLFGQEVSASQLAEIPEGKLVGVVSAKGSGNSHVAILARALNIPAVMGVADLPIGRLDGRPAIVDGYTGRLFIDPPPQVRREYRRLLHQEAELSKDLQGLKTLAAETPDGYRVQMYTNTGLMADIKSSLESGCDGIGLHRTEFPFMVRDRFPGEEEQTSIYEHVLKPFKPRPVILRTLDVGGDKMLSYFPVHEENPFLGWRGIRLTLDHPEIFLTQLRAMLRANIGNENLQIMFPMVSRVQEVDEALSLLRRAHRELREDGMEISMPTVGVMVEVPAAVYQADHLARKVDFLSIGTNDLTQYVLAVDRNNARVANLFDELHPAVLRSINAVVRAGRQFGKPVGVCGGMAGDPAAAILLLGMGVQSLSMTVSSLLRLKWMIRSISRGRAQELLAEALEMESPLQVRALLNAALEQAGLGGLVRPGK